MTFLKWLNIEFENAVKYPIRAVVATIFYLFAWLISMSIFIPTIQDEAFAVCFQGTQAPLCSYPSTRPKCSDYK